MGLVKAAVDAVNSTLSDQWEDYITCNELSSDVLIVRKTTKSGQISSKSRIQVNPGQAIIVVDSGKILDVSAEEGVYSFDSSSSPSIFAGQFGASLKEVWDRFKFGGQAAKNQEIYYINIQGEIQGNKFGSQTPIPYRDPVYRNIYIRYFGSYTFRVSNPLIFFHNVANDIGEMYRKEKLLDQADGEFIMNIDDAIGSCADCEKPVEFSLLTKQQKVIAAYMNDALDADWVQKRGIEVVSVALEKITPDDESRKRIEKFDNSAMYSNPEFANGRMIDATANAMEAAAGNANGAANGFMGLGMMNMGMNNMMGGSPLNYVNQNAQAQQAPAAPVETPAPVVEETPAVEETVEPVSEEVVAPVEETAAPAEEVVEAAVVAAPAVAAKFCTNCGQEVTGKFCSNCGTPAPVEEKPKVCPKCGATPVEGAKFCVECGSSLSE